MKVISLKSAILSTTISLSALTMAQSNVKVCVQDSNDVFVSEQKTNKHKYDGDTCYFQLENILKPIYEQYKPAKFVYPFVESVNSGNIKNYVTPKGVLDDEVLKYAPSPNVNVKDKKFVAKVVVDLKQNILYNYDSLGNPKAAYLVASGRQDSPTTTGLRIVTHVESYPYKYAGVNTKRYNNPRDYGPRIICLNILDEKTGLQSQTGEFIHGNNNPKSIGNYASNGCIRMDNEVIKILAKDVKKGDIIKIQ